MSKLKLSILTLSFTFFSSIYIQAEFQFDAKLFVDSSQVNYPTGVMVAPDGKSIYVSSDQK